MHVPISFLRLALMAALFLHVSLTFPGRCRADRIWWDGTRDTENAPPGKLLSDNAGWWGESVQTGVEYHYETAPDGPVDSDRDDKARFGRRLLDGIPMGDWYVPVGHSGDHPLVTVFDFKQPCTFNEVDVVTQDAGGQPAILSTKIEVGDGEAGPWRTVLERPAEGSAPKRLYRLPLPHFAGYAPVRGRFLRLSVQNPRSTTFLNEVLVWGDVFPARESTAPSLLQTYPSSMPFASLPNITGTLFSAAQFRDWQRGAGTAGKQTAIWSHLATWEAITDKPLLPSAAERTEPIALIMARNETECAALALTNTSMETTSAGEVVLGAFTRSGTGGSKSADGIRGEILAAGIIRSRNFGVNPGPLLAADNMPGRSLMGRRLTNAMSIQAFPRLTLPPAGSSLLWLSVTTDGAKPGIYRAQLSYGDEAPLTISVEVLDVTLPRPFVWLQTWSETTGMFPFVYGDRLAREVAYKQGIGATVWNHLPNPGSPAALARQHGRTFFQILALPLDYVNRGYNNTMQPKDITPTDETAVTAHIHALVAQTKALGLGYDDWSAELWDEPGRVNAALFGAFARIVKQADPKVHIYCNPCFWEGNGVADDDALQAALSPWYGDVVGVSAPLALLLHDHPSMKPAFAAPRLVNASYAVATQSAKSGETSEIVRYRRMAWDAFARGENGWGFYSYYAPRGDPWDDFDGAPGENAPDYEMVYPGPRGPIPTRQSESVREGWEDYCLLTLLKQHGLSTELAALLRDYAAGQPLETLRLRALRAVAHSK